MVNSETNCLLRINQFCTGVYLSNIDKSFQECHVKMYPTASPAKAVHVAIKATVEFVIQLVRCITVLLVIFGINIFCAFCLTSVILK